MSRSSGSHSECRVEGERRGCVRGALLLLATAGVTVAVAACGSSGTSSGGSASHPTSAQLQHDAVRFADCMRSSGVSGFPDPTSPHELKFSLSPSSGANASSPAFHSAEAGCRHLLPGGGPHGESAPVRQTHTVALLAFARCLRGHGFPSFPDPNSGGQVTHEMLAQAGINLNQPAVVQSADACVGVTHGVITRAVVAKFIAGQ